MKEMVARKKSEGAQKRERMRRLKGQFQEGATDSECDHVY